MLAALFLFGQGRPVVALVLVLAGVAATRGITVYFRRRYGRGRESDRERYLRMASVSKGYRLAGLIPMVAILVWATFFRGFRTLGHSPLAFFVLVAMFANLLWTVACDPTNLRVRQIAYGVGAASIWLGGLCGLVWHRSASIGSIPLVMGALQIFDYGLLLRLTWREGAHAG
jgi:hypothetical protein